MSLTDSLGGPGKKPLLHGILLVKVKRIYSFSFLMPPLQVNMILMLANMDRILGDN